MAGSPDRNSRETFALMITRVFPDLPESEREALWRAWTHLERWTARLPRDLPFEAEPAHIFVAPERRS